MQVAGILESDIYYASSPITASTHFPCPGSLSPCPLNLALLQTCRTIYYEARTMPYELNSFHTWELSSFSNFTYCLKSWQIRSISHLSLDLSDSFGGNTAAWNESLAVIARAFVGLKTLSITIWLGSFHQAFRPNFWSGGLLDLDRLQLQGLRLVIYGRPGQPVFDYSAGTGVELPVEHFNTHLRQCGTGLEGSRLIMEDCDQISYKGTVSKTASTQQSEIKFSAAQKCLEHIYADWAHKRCDAILPVGFHFDFYPLYMRDMLERLPESVGNAEIQGHNLFTRKYAFCNAYDKSDGGRHPIIGYQFHDDTPPEEINRGVEMFLEARKRLKRSHAKWAPVYQAEAQKILQERRARRMSRGSQLEQKPCRDKMGYSLLEQDGEPGEWRHRLVAETVAPLIETFPWEVPKLARVETDICIDCPKKGPGHPQ
ncbi:hypothetical protein DTO166G4_7380 [Paecilomyces variotii]|nr:hypothetical protein DTO166G4_7380 [Paecilomyces variotii]